MNAAHSGFAVAAGLPHLSHLLNESEQMSFCFLSVVVSCVSLPRWPLLCVNPPLPHLTLLYAPHGSPGAVCEHGDGAGLSRSELDSLLLQLFSALGSVDSLCDFAPPQLLKEQVALHWLAPHHLNIYCLVVAVLFAFAGRSARDEHYIGTLPIPNKRLWAV